MQELKIEKKDNVLVKEYINGNEFSLERLIKRHEQRLYGFIYSKVQNRDITEDVFQDTFIKVIKTLKKGTYNEEGKFLSWIMRISHNLIIDHYRRDKRMPMFNNPNKLGDFDIFSLIKDDALNIEDQYIRNQVLTDVGFLLDELPIDQQEVLRMRFFNGLSFNEIAENTGVSINTSLGRMRYALINLRKMVEENNISLVS